MASYSFSTLRDRIREDMRWKRAEPPPVEPCDHSQKVQLGSWCKENSPIKRIKWLCIKCDHEWVEDEVQL